ncbi:MAG: gephyrin-like molybdotransferase Glp [Dehalococcoidia bacterium]
MTTPAMISVEDALARILSFANILDAETKPLNEALGQVLAEDIRSPVSIPPLANTAMDGYAVRAADTEGAAPDRPVELKVIGELAAGYLFDGAVQAGEAVRIMTGAAIPAGADAIVPFEETNEGPRTAPKGARVIEEAVQILKAARVHANIRDAGEDVREGDLVLNQGRLLRPADIGVIASVGRAAVSVIRRPVVAILSTGDELLEPGQEAQPGRIYDSNAWSLGALVSSYGGVPLRLGIAEDTLEALTAKVREGFSADMLVTSAGVSRGDYDIVKDVLAREGDIAFWTVRMKPGKPLAFGTFDAGGRRIPHLGLPGNPVSSIVSFELFGRPAIQKMMGRPVTPRPTVQAISDDRITNIDDPRRFYARCLAERGPDGWRVRLTGGQGSGQLGAMARANALAILPEGLDIVEPGDSVQVMLLEAEDLPSSP